MYRFAYYYEPADGGYELRFFDFPEYKKAFIINSAWVADEIAAAIQAAAQEAIEEIVDDIILQGKDFTEPTEHQSSYVALSDEKQTLLVQYVNSTKNL